MSEKAAAAGGSGEPAGAFRWAKAGVVTIRCRENGPLVIELPEGEGAPGVRVIDHEGGEFILPGGKRAVALCRCGSSGSKPFCDGSHREGGFLASELSGTEGKTR